ncbi:MAG: bifunctional tetrahydrofolate synthase/dihydrofolate synthase [Candidatus Thiodiazotropha sp.]
MRFNTLDEWLDWQSTLHPKEIELGLDRVSRVWRNLHPGAFRAALITIAGTNGKGSCAALLESIYRQAGYQVGSYTSPHLRRYNERVRLNGVNVTDEALCRAFDRIDQARDDVPLTYFEFGTLAALLLFAEADLDVLILEVGLGGRLDAVNIVDPDVALITTVDLDHCDWLGSDRQQIGREKAGIMRPLRPVVLGDPQMPESVLSHARSIRAGVYLAGREFHADAALQGWVWFQGRSSGIRLPDSNLQGKGQRYNASAVVMVTRLLQDRLPLTWDQLAEGLRRVSLPGRLQLIPGSPSLLLDVAHNPQAVDILTHHLKQLNWSGRVFAVAGLLQDKDARDILTRVAPQVERWFLVDLTGSRGRDAGQLARVLAEIGAAGEVSCHADVTDAWHAAHAAATVDDLLLIFGSFLIVGAALELWDSAPQGKP